MFRGTYVAAVVVFWGVSMAWLVSTKVLPSWRQTVLTSNAGELAELASWEHPLTWTILWSGREVGWSTTRAELQPDGTCGLHHEMELRHLSVLDASRELLGPMAHVLAAGWSERIPDVDIRLSSLMRFDRASHLRGFSTRVDVQGLSTVMRLEGEVRGQDLEVTVLAPREGREHEWQELLRRTVHFPPSAKLADALTPPSRYAELNLGDQWTLPVYRLFPPNDPIQIVRASVDEDDLIEWNGSLVATKVVVFRPDAGQGPTVSQQPISKVWVRADGTVLQQEARISRAVVRFVRQPTVQGPSP